MEYINSISDYLFRQSWQIAVLFLIVAIGSLLLRNKSSHWRYLLWCIILAKCLIPPVITFKAAVLPVNVVSSNSAVIEEPRHIDSKIENGELNNQNPNHNIQTISNNQNPKLDSRESGNDTSIGGVNRPMRLYAFSVWGIGAIMFLLIAGVKAFLLNRWILQNRQKPCADLIGEIEKLKNAVPAELLNRVWTIDSVSQPFVWGLWRGAVYLPAKSKNSADVIMHELAHVMRLDAFVNLLQIFAQAIFWFHPFVWLANKKIRNEREKSCDEIAIARLNISPQSYSSAVVDVLVREYQSSRTMPSLAVAGPVKNIEDRIKTIMAQGKRFYSRPTAAAVISVLILAAIFVPTTIALTKVGEPDFVIKGKVVDSTTGKPITGATVGDNKEYNKGIFCDVTDSNGYYEYKTWQEEHNIVAEADGYKKTLKGYFSSILQNEKEKIFDFALEPNSQNRKSTPAPIVQMCEPQIDPNREDMQILAGQKGEPGTLSGRVLDEKGNPLKNVWVNSGPRRKEFAPHSDIETYTDANGYFYISGFEAEQKTVEIEFSKEDFTPRYIIQQPLGIKDAVIVLGNKTYFEGTVSSPDGKAIAGATIKAITSLTVFDGGAHGEVPTECKSDKNGYYKLYVQADNYDIQVKAEQGVVRLQNTKINKNEAKKLDLKLNKGIIFFAKVIDSQTKEPVKGVRLFHWAHPGVEGVSDSNGFIRIPNMLPGKFEFWAESKEYCRWWSEDCLSEWNRYKIKDEKTGWQRNFDLLDFDLKDTIEPVTIIVEKGVKITGKILDPTGKPVEGATATLARTGSGNSLTGDTRYSFATDANGNFEMIVPASKKAKYNLVAHDGKFEQWRNWANGVLEPIQTNPGNVINDIVIKLTEPAAVKGTVVDNSGKAVPNNQVRASAFDKLENRYYDPTARTDANGNFEIKFIRPGKHYIQAAPFWLYAEQAPEGTSQIVTVSENQLLEGVKLIAETPAGQDTNRTVEQENSRAGEAIPLNKTTDTAQITNIMVTMGGVFNAARTAIQSPGGGADSGAKIMEEAMPQFEKFESTVEGTNISDSIHLIIERIRQAIKANKDGDSARAAALIAASGDSWNELKNIVTSDSVNNRSLSLKSGFKTDVQIGTVEQVSSGTGEVEKQQNVDVYIEDFKISPYEAGGLYTATVKIGNRGDATAPPFRMNFFKGEAKDNLNLHGKPQTGYHGAGPIKPGDFWNECSSPFALNQGENVLSVVLDIDNSIAETNELNNSATIITDAEGRSRASELKATEGIGSPNNGSSLFDQSLLQNVTVDIDKSPDGSGLTVQYAVIAVCQAAGVPYKWEKSAQLAEPHRRTFIEPLHIKDIPARKAITDILKPFGLDYVIDSDGLFIYKISNKTPAKDNPTGG